TLARDTRRIVASRSGDDGWASGSDSAAALASSSVMASSRVQSVAPFGKGSPSLSITRVVPVLLIPISLPRRNYTANIIAAHRHNDEQNGTARHPDDLKPLLA